MGKKYLDTKKDSLESSILGVWKTAIEEGDARETAVMDGRTKSYKEHRAKLETARQRREGKKINKEEVELDEVDELDYLTDEELDQLTDEEVDLFELDDEMFEAAMKKKSAGDRKKAAKARKKWAKTAGGKKAAKKAKKRAKKVRSGAIKVDPKKAKAAKRRAKLYSGYNEEVDELDYLTDEELDQLTDEEVDLFELDDEMFEAVMKKKSAGERKVAAKKRAKYAKTAGGKKAAKKAKKRAAKIRSGAIKVDPKKAKAAKRRAKLYSGYAEFVDPRKLPNMREALMQVRLEKHDTHVDPKDREELDLDVKDSAKKMKRSQEPAPNQMAEASGDKEAYKKFFDAAMKKFKIDSPADLKSDEEKKKFYDYIDKGWEGDNEKAEGAMSQVREFKIQSMKAALAQVWGMEEGKNPFKKEDHDDEENKKKTKTETGKKPAVIDLKPKIDDR